MVAREPDRHTGRGVDAGLPEERTALAWERTAIAVMVSGVLLTRYAAQSAHWTTALAGLIQTAIGGALLVWAGVHYADQRGPIAAGSGVVHPAAARIVGLTTVVFSGFALMLALFEATAN